MNEDDRFPDSDAWLTATDRKRSILTRDDRKYLIGEKELSGDARRVAEGRIGKRIADGLRDLAFLIETDNSRRITSATDRFPPNVELTVRRHVAEVGLRNLYTYAYHSSGYADNPKKATHAKEDLENELELLLPDILLGIEYTSIESIDVTIDIDGSTDVEEYLLDQLVHDDIVSESVYSQYVDIAGGTERLKEELMKENEKIKIHYPSHDQTMTLTPDNLR